MSGAARSDLIPNANRPAVLAHAIELIARGLRTPRGLQEALGLDPRTVQYYLQAGAWLGLLEVDGEASLTPLGLEYAYAGRSRPRVYARAVWAQPFVAELMAGRSTVPSVDEVAEAIAAKEPQLSPATARRRASAVRSLLEPALQARPSGPRSEPQLELPFATPSGSASPPPVGRGRPTEYDPDLYRFLLAALLDAGELTLGGVRALLDRAGVGAAPIGGYVDLAVTRGDAVRYAERLVATRGAASRRAVFRSTTGVILSDKAWRAWLDDALAAASGDRRAEIRRDGAARRFRAWDLRLFGREPTPATLQADLERALLDRSLQSFPVSGDPGAPYVPVEQPFLDVHDHGGIPIALPPAIGVLRGGLAAINRELKEARMGPMDVRPPQLTDRPAVVHGGLLHPGEPLPRAIPDLVSLRVRTLMCCPYAALLAAALLLHRERPDTLEIAQVGGRWIARSGATVLGEALDLLDGFAASAGHVVLRREGAVPMADLVAALDALGVVVVVGKHVLLAERFFARLRGEAEEMEVHARLRPLAEALEDYVSSRESA